MGVFSHDLPQLSGDPFICDGGIETDLIFNHGIDIPEFAAHTLLGDEVGQKAMEDYFHAFLDLARDLNVGFILDSQTWKAHAHWASDLGVSEEELRAANHRSISFISSLRDKYAANSRPVVLSGIIGPKGDGYTPDQIISTRESEDYHHQQISWLAETDVDMVSAVTFTQSGEAAGVVNAAHKSGLPAVVSFTVETDGRLPTGQTVEDAIRSVDDATNSKAAYFMINCAHPDHFQHILEDSDWARRIHGVRCNASRKSHAELDESETLDAGDPVELAGQYRQIKATMPWINIYGGCCGSDLRHVTEIARVLVN